MDSSDPAGWHFLHMIRFIFYSVRTLIHQQSPKLVLTDSNMGLMLIASANLITKVSLMLQAHLLSSILQPPSNYASMLRFIVE